MKEIMVVLVIMLVCLFLVKIKDEI